MEVILHRNKLFINMLTIMPLQFEENVTYKLGSLAEKTWER